MSDTDKSDRQFRQSLQFWLQLTQTLLTCAAIISGWWYFFYRGEIRSKLLLDQEIETVHLSESLNLMNISLRMENAGDTPLNIGVIKCRVQQVRPLSDELRELAASTSDLVADGERWVDFPLVRNKIVDYNVLLLPGETEVVTLEITLPRGVEVAKVYIFAAKTAEDTIGWRSTRLHTLEKG